MNAAEEAGTDMITGLLNQIIIGAIPAEWELTIIRNYKGMKRKIRKRKL